MSAKYVNIFEHFKKQNIVEKCKEKGINIKGKENLNNLELIFDSEKNRNMN